MKIPAILAYDDLDHTEKDERNEAHATRHISVDGTWYELDLTSDHAIEFDRVVRRYVSAGVLMDAPPKPSARQPRKSQGHGGRRNGAYYEGLVAWVDENRIIKRDGSGRPAYEGRNGRNDYPEWLITEYDAHLARQGTPASHVRF